MVYKEKRRRVPIFLWPTHQAKRRFLCRLCTCIFIPIYQIFTCENIGNRLFFTAIFLDVVKPLWLNFGVIYTTIFQIFTCEIIENIHIYLFQYFLNFPLITKKINAKNLKMCKDNTIKKSKPLASVNLYRELRNFNSIPCTLYIEE